MIPKIGGQSYSEIAVRTAQIIQKSKQQKPSYQSMERINGRLAAKMTKDKMELYKLMCRECGNKEFIAGIQEAIKEGLDFLNNSVK